LCALTCRRFFSLEHGRPPLIHDEDCQVDWPCPVDDDLIQPSVILKQPSGSKPSSLAAVIPVVRFISQLKTTLKSRTISPQTLRTYDEYFNAVMSTFPDEFKIHSSRYLEPYNLTVTFFLQTARFHLYRHNLSIVVPQNERVEAMNRCHSVAKDTVKYISRTLQTPPNSPSTSNSIPTQHSSTEADMSITRTERWQSSIKSTVLNMGCAHLWRCALILCFRADFSVALTCVRVSAAIGELRNYNLKCGRHLEFFLETLLGRWRAGRGRQELLQFDEEMIAYLSADLQGSESGWIWSGSETGWRLNTSSETREPSVRIDAPNRAVAGGYGGEAHLNGDNMPPNQQDGSAGGQPSSQPEKAALDPASSLLTRTEKIVWGGWERVEQLIHELMEEQQRQNRAYDYDYSARYDTERNEAERARGHGHYHQPAHNTGKRLQLAPPDAEAPARLSRTPPLPPPPPPPQAQHEMAQHRVQREQSQGRERSEGASRISIANII
jgi:hypothetical protein